MAIGAGERQSLRIDRRGNVCVLEPSRARQGHPRLHRCQRPCGVRRSGSGLRPRRGAAHRAVGARRGAVRRLSRLGAGRTVADPHRRFRLSRRRRRVVRGDRRRAGQLPANRPHHGHPGRERVAYPAGAPCHPAPTGRAAGAARPGLDGHRLGSGGVRPQHPFAGLRWLFRRVLDLGTSRLGIRLRHEFQHPTRPRRHDHRCRLRVGSAADTRKGRQRPSVCDL